MRVAAFVLDEVPASGAQTKTEERHRRGMLMAWVGASMAGKVAGLALFAAMGVAAAEVEAARLTPDADGQPVTCADADVPGRPIVGLRGRDVHVTWSPPGSHCATEYLLEFGLSAGTTAGSIVVPQPAFTEPAFTYANAPVGTYFIRVRSRDAFGGMSRPSTETIVRPFAATCVAFASVARLCIAPADDREPADRVPLLLVHGLNPRGSPASPDLLLWTSFLAYFWQQPGLADRYRPYLVTYESNVAPVVTIANALVAAIGTLDERDPSFARAPVAFVTHSMGGLIARTAMELPSAQGRALGERTLTVVTLGTPHLGTPVANAQPGLDLLAYLFGSVVPPELVNRVDLHWQAAGNPFLELLNSRTQFDSRVHAMGGSLAADTRCNIPNSNKLCYVAGSLEAGGFGPSDGVVPASSAVSTRFPSRQLLQGYDHYEVAKGKCDVALAADEPCNDVPLFGSIAAAIGRLLPGAPSAQVNGSTVALGWSPPLLSLPFSGFAVEYRSAGSDSWQRTQAASSPLVVSGVPPGVYEVRVRGANDFGVGPASEITGLTVLPPPSLPVPSEPRGFTAAVSGSTVSFSWQPPLVGAPLTGYLLEAGTSSAGYPVQLPLGPAATSLAVPSVPAGSYFVRLRAANTSGLGPPSAAVRVTIGSPITTQIVFSSNRDGNQEIYAVDAAGADLRRLTIHPADDNDPTLSPNGSRVAFWSRRSGSPQIFTMAQDGSDVRQLTFSSGQNLGPSFSPDGSRIVFHSYRFGASELFLMNTDGSQEQRLTFNQGDNHSAQFTPDGTRIVYHCRFTSADVCIMNADGSNQRRLTTAAADDGQPTVRPDGTAILFYSSRTGVQQLWTMNLDGSDQRQLTFNSAGSFSPAWSPAGDRIVYARAVSGGTVLRVMDADGAADTVLVTGGSNDVPHWGVATPLPDRRFTTGVTVQAPVSRR